MDEITAKNLESRNDQIISIVLEKIARYCPYSIELFGIGGSFCNGDFYEKSDLDLVLISKGSDASCLDKCFILNDVGFDIYTHDWKSFEKAALYPNPYVTKLIDLKIIKASEDGIKHYEGLQNQLKASMEDDEKIGQNIRKHYESLVQAFAKMQEANDMGTIYRKLAEVLKYAEYIVYMSNKTYVKRGVKRIPSEIASMKHLPKNFMEIYENIISLSDEGKVKTESEKLIGAIGSFLGYEIQVPNLPADDSAKQKKDVTPKNLAGTYEEICSNWYNKMLHAAEINSRYLSFITMASCQEFYDEMFDEFNIPKIELISKYNPNDLNENILNFELAMAEWKKNYDKFGIKIARYDDLNKFREAYIGLSKQ